MANLFADLTNSMMTFEEMEDPSLESPDQDHPHLVLFADPFLCSSSDPSTLYNLELGESELLFHKDRAIQDGEEDSTTLLSDAFQEQGMQNDNLYSSKDAADAIITEKKANKKRKYKNGDNLPARYRPTSRNAARERSRVKSLRLAFLELQNSLPSVPPNTKLSKLDVLVLATTYIAHLMKTLNEGGGSMDQQHKNILEEADGFQDVMTPTGNVITLHDAMSETVNQCTSNIVSAEEHHHRLQEKGYLHPVRKWPMRSRLYAGVFEEHVRYVSSTGSTLQTLALPDINYSMPLLDANLNVLFSFAN